MGYTLKLKNSDKMKEMIEKALAELRAMPSDEFRKLLDKHLGEIEEERDLLEQYHNNIRKYIKYAKNRKPSI